MKKSTTVISRMVLSVAVVAALTTACGGGDDDLRSDLVAKIKADKEMKDMPDKAVDCVVDVYLKYADHDELKAALKSGSNADVKGLDMKDKNLMADMAKCTK